MAIPDSKFLSDPAPRIGDILVARENISKAELDQALKIQSSRDALLGEIIISHKLATQADVESALEIQFGGISLDLSLTEPDPELLVGIDPVFCLKYLAIPWQKLNGTVLVAAADPACQGLLQEIDNKWHGTAILVRADPKTIQNCITNTFAPELAQIAKNLCPERHSCREIASKFSGIFGGLFLASIALAIYLSPGIAFLGVFFWAMLINLATTIMRAAAVLFFLLGHDRKNIPPLLATRLSDFRKRPKVTVLVPLYRENGVLDSLFLALAKLTYPKELLDIKILLEEEDSITAGAISTRDLPRWIDVIVVPKDILQTKPRAMNYALSFCKGEIVGIYDAEDRPDPDQIDKVVAHLMAAPKEVGSVQCILDFYNPDSNWMARCFTIEYAVWFRVIMRGLQRMGAPLPLGGTSVFVRRNVLEQVGAWDAHNVTEDADLGMRMARYGYKCEVVASTTWEEANNRPVAWIKQRSRWLKGFAMTWATHMRNPLSLFKELGLIGFIGFQVILLGTVTSFLVAPVFWIVWTGYLGVEWHFFETLPIWAWHVAFAFLMLGEITMIVIAFIAIALKSRLTLAPFVFSLFLYWPLGTIAAFKALFELFFAPFYWDKTDHGLD